MIDLGHMRIENIAGIPDARSKFLSVCLAFMHQRFQATRLAAGFSQWVRQSLQNQCPLDLSMALDWASSGATLHLEFQSGERLAPPGLLSPFFEILVESSAESGKLLKVTCPLPPADKPSPQTLQNLRELVERKDRDTLMAEITERNRELQESLDNLRRTTNAKERMETELNVGRDIQMSMLPVDFEAFSDRPEFDIHAVLHPAREVGGDFYDFFFIDDTHLCFCVGDVSGKGVPAALFMAVTKTLIKSRGSGDLSPGSILTHVNDEVSQNNESCMFITLWLAILDFSTGTLKYSNAGHNPPYVLKEGDPPLRLDDLHGPVVGAVEGIAYRESVHKLTNRDLLFVYTDGVTEAMDIKDALYSEERLVDALAPLAQAGASGVVDAVAQDVWRFQGKADQADDVTILGLNFFKEESGASAARLDLSMKNDLSAIADIIQTFTEFAEENGLGTAIRRKINLALDDLLNNVVSYAYEDDAEHEVQLHVELSDKRLGITIRDDGIPFNPFDMITPKITEGVDDREVGGLGVHLVRRLMDDVTYHRRTGENVVQFFKNLSEPQDKEDQK
jgi:sigma-B regulation protein RsbU (phosphoserine phosphatase)